MERRDADEANLVGRRAVAELNNALRSGDTAGKAAAAERLRETLLSERPTDVPNPAGRWVEAPERRHGHEFNKTYETWVRTTTGGPVDREYLVTNETNKQCHFDGRYVDDRDGQPTEVLVDAKGRYAQFIDTNTGDWHPWFSSSKTSGVGGMLNAARDQVKAAQGRPTEWWCAERDVVRLLNRSFRLDNRLAGNIRAVHRPMPDPKDEAR